MTQLRTQLTELLGIQHPIMLAGMFVASGPRLAAAVTNAGGIGVIGGLTLTPKQRRTQIADLKRQLNDKNAPFGVDLAIPKIGGGARKTNHDYTHGHLDELIDIIIEEKAKIFVCDIGVCPKYIVDKLHKNGVYVANMIGHPSHVEKVAASGVDIICAQGGEGGGHTGPVPFSILIPSVVTATSGKLSGLGKQIIVVAAGGVFDGRSLAAALMFGAEGVWVGTRFVASVEAAAPQAHKKQIVSAGWGDTTTTLIYSGRPLRVKKTPYVTEWNERRADEIAELTGRGIVPHQHEVEKNPKRMMEGHPFLMGDVASRITSVLPAKEIVDNMVKGAVEQIQKNYARL